ncbi:MAG: GTPase (G3E family) [Lachnospiraceae bacterium]|nr:GTPase (G3E family) [Lachnospiraceae bacterium]
MIKVDLITGFLGSGKTTFIEEYGKWLVGKGERIAIIVNDYGAINVDRLLLEAALGDACHLEMVIGGDPDCHRRRLKTKLITMGMEKYDHVLIEPSGIFDVDEFFDLLYEEPLERWYELGNVITIVDGALGKDLSNESRYLLASQISKAGEVVLSKADDITDTAKQDMLAYLNQSLKLFKCNRKIEDLYIWKRGDISEADFCRLSSCSYRRGDMIKLPVSENNQYTSAFYFHVKTPIEKLRTTIESIFADKEVGNIYRIKGFIKDQTGHWLEVNATKQHVTIREISVGQELFIVIGEHLHQDKIGSYWDEYSNEV